MDDKYIVDLYWQRNEQAISETSRKYGKYCHSIAFGILGNNEDAEETVNDTYNSAWNSIPPHRPTVLSVFLGKITRRISIDKVRYKNAEKRGGGELPQVLDELLDSVAVEDDVIGEMEKKRLTETLNAFVKSLPKTEKNVFICRYWYMETIDKIGKRFGFSESKVKVMLCRTRKKLHDVLVKEGFQ